VACLPRGIRSMCAPQPTAPSRVRVVDDGPQAALALPPSWFLTTSTVSSSARLAGLLHPAASRGSTRFGTDRPAPAHRERAHRLDRPGPSPHRSSHPSKNSPHRQPHRITAAVAPLTLTRIPPRRGRRRGSGPKTSTSSRWLRKPPPTGPDPRVDALAKRLGRPGVATVPLHLWLPRSLAFEALLRR
jgi:hypothetical protein